MLIRKIERFLHQTQMPATVFGRRAVGDPRFVFDLRNGREPRGKTERRVECFIKDYRKENHAN